LQLEFCKNILTAFYYSLFFPIKLALSSGLMKI